MSRKHFVYLTTEEILVLSVIAEILLKDPNYLSQLKDVPISEKFKEDLRTANEKLDEKIQELSNEADRK